MLDVHCSSPPPTCREMGLPQPHVEMGVSNNKILSLEISFCSEIVCCVD